MKYYVTIAGREVLVDLSAEPLIDGQRVRAALSHLPGTAVRSLLLDSESRTLIARPGPERGSWELLLAGRNVSAEVVDERTRAIRAMSGATEKEKPKVISAPMPGLVVRINVQPGDTIHAGQGVIVVEAMKMENELKSPAAGRVARIHATVGQPVEKGAVLVVLE
jgi:biotin carboxyl carrier protein